MDQYSTGFIYLKNKFPRTCDAKIKEGVFVGPQIRELIQDIRFEYLLSEVERVAWKSLKNVTSNILGNHKVENYHDMVIVMVI
jgi:hypothetical protein